MLPNLMRSSIHNIMRPGGLNASESSNAGIQHCDAPTIELLLPDPAVSLARRQHHAAMMY